MACGIDKAAGDEVRDAKDAVRRRWLVEQLTGSEDAGLVTGAAGADKRDPGARFGRGRQKARFTGNHAWGAGGGGDNGQTAALCSHQVVQGFLHRRAIVDINIVRAGELPHAVDRYYLLSTLQAEFNQGCGRFARQHDGGG